MIAPVPAEKPAKRQMTEEQRTLMKGLRAKYDTNKDGKLDAEERKAISAEDKEKMNKELMDLYRRYKVNPMSGCLPMAIQIPVFFSLYKVIYVTIEMRHAPFFGWIQDLAAPDPTTVFNLFGLLPFTPPAMLMIGIWPLIMGVTMWVQMKMTLKDPNQKAMVWLMPIMMFLFSCSFPSGLVVYWTVSNLFTIAQTKIFTPKPSPIVGRIKTAKA